MNKVYKKTISLFTFPFFIAVSLLAQQNHFIYLQTENKQSFYVKLDKKILSSSISGYLIIPKLQEGKYELTIGFPKNEWTEQNVTCSVNKKDAGYLLKNFGDKGWGLFNIQTMEVIMAAVKAAENKSVEESIKNDVFSNTLSNVVNDPSIAKKTEDKPVIKEEVKPVIEIAKKEELINLPEQITKLFSITTANGTEMIYVDIANGQTDTIMVFIPAEKSNELAQPHKKVEEQLIELPKKEDVKNDEIKKVDAKFIDIELPNPTAKMDTGSKQPVQEIAKEKETDVVQIPEKVKDNVSKPIILNSDCKNLATENDFLKLRKKMVTENSDEDMVNTAKKVFRSRCFTTEQIKNLSVLFLKDEGKYKFFDVAYAFVSDSYNFQTLETQLSDNYFITRFKAMMKH